MTAFLPSSFKLLHFTVTVKSSTEPPPHTSSPSVAFFHQKVLSIRTTINIDRHKLNYPLRWAVPTNGKGYQGIITVVTSEHKQIYDTNENAAVAYIGAVPTFVRRQLVEITAIHTQNNPLWVENLPSLE